MLSYRLVIEKCGPMLAMSLLMGLAMNCMREEKNTRTKPDAVASTYLYENESAEVVVVPFAPDGTEIARLILPPHFLTYGTRVEMRALPAPDLIAAHLNTPNSGPAFEVHFLNQKGEEATVFGEAALEILVTDDAGRQAAASAADQLTALYAPVAGGAFKEFLYTQASYAAPAQALKAPIFGSAIVQVGRLIGPLSEAFKAYKPQASLGLADSDEIPRCPELTIDDGVTFASLDATPELSWTLKYVTSFLRFEVAIGTSAGASDVMGWTDVAKVSTKQFTGLNLTVDRVYYASVRAINASGAVIVSKSGDGWTATSPSAPNQAPVAGTSLVSGSVTDTSVSISWGAASDDSTVTSSLQYRLVKSTNAADIDTAEKIAAITGGDVLVDWEAATLSKSVTGLTTGSTYYFAVAVRDQSSAMAAYPALWHIASHVPTAGTAISIGTQVQVSLYAETVPVNWGAATDSADSASSLQYRLVRAYDSRLIDTASEVMACTNGCSVVMDWTANTMTFSAASMPTNSKMYFAVAVKNTTSGVSVYTPKDVTTNLLAAGLSAAPSFNYYVAGRLTASNVGSVNSSEWNTGSSVYNNFAAVGGAIGSNILDGDMAIAIDSSDVPWMILRRNMSCGGGNGWVGYTQIYAYESASWGQKGTDLYGTAGCTGSSGTFIPNIYIAAGTTPYVTLKRSTGSWHHAGYKWNGSGWDTLGSLGGDGGWHSLFHDGTDFYAFGNLGGSARLSRYTTSWGGVSTFGATNVDEPYALPGQRIAKIGSNFYAAYTDADDNFLAKVKRYDGSSWSALGTAVSAGAASNINIAVAGGVPYVMYRDATIGGDVVLKAWNSSTSTWDTKVAQVFGEDVISPTIGVHNDVIYMVGVKVSDRAKATRVVFTP